MGDIVEAVAKAIYEATHSKNMKWDKQHAKEKAFWRSAARVAIAAYQAETKAEHDAALRAARIEKGE